jgi:hypothetical protein
MERKEGQALVSYSSRHLLAAVHFARASKSLESLNAELRAEGDISFASGAIMSAAAFLEATINQLFSEGLSSPLP